MEGGSGQGHVRDVDFNPEAGGQAPMKADTRRRTHSGEMRGLGRKGSIFQMMTRVTKESWEADKDLNAQGHQPRRGQDGYWAATAYLGYQALGIVYGDIGTSPMYVFASTFHRTPDRDDVLGATSLIIYALTAIIIVKYSLIVLRADDHGNGGTFALYSILKRAAEVAVRSKKHPTDPGNVDQKDSGILNDVDHSVSIYNKEKDERSLVPPGWRRRLIRNQTMRKVIRFLVVIGVGAILGDGVLTPAITVVSACEGIQVAYSHFSKDAVVGVALAIIACLFLIQRFGTTRVGVMFSPIVIVWLLLNIGVGVVNIIRFFDTAIFQAFSPHHIVNFFIRNKAQGWRMLGGILMSVTGAEALYADLGHFNKDAIMISCIGLVYPALVTTYLGQGAFLLKRPEEVAQTFWKSLPNGMFWPMFFSATFAAVVASQALISAVFQIVYQAVHQDFFPKFRIVHTSEHVAGQVYVPVINYILMTLTLIVVATFKSSEKLGKAYGLAVMIDMLLTTHFITLVMISVWRTSLFIALPFYVFYLVIEGAFLSAAVVKIPQGGWFSLMMASLYAIVMLLWFGGQHGKKKFFMKRARSFEDVLKVEKRPGTAERKVYLYDGNEIARRPGTGIYYSYMLNAVPPHLIEQLKVYRTVHQLCIFMTNRHVWIPKVEEKDRFLVNAIGQNGGGFYHAIARYGYMEKIKQGEGYKEKLLEYIEGLLLRDLLRFFTKSTSLCAELSPEESSTLGIRPEHELVEEHGLTGKMREALSGVLERLSMEKGKILEEKSNIPHEKAVMDSVLSLSQEIQIVRDARSTGEVHYVFGRTYVRRVENTNWYGKIFKRHFLEIPFDVMVNNFTGETYELFDVPVKNVIEIALGYEVYESDKKNEEESQLHVGDSSTRHHSLRVSSAE